MKPLQAAQALLDRGLRPIPVPFREKGPKLPGWQNLRLTAGDLAAHFNGRPMNVGVLLGEASNWIVDVDLDHELARQWGDELLPATNAVFGREGAPRSHRLYRLTVPTATKKWTTAAGAMILELRSTGCQTVAPGSTHPSGELVRWDVDGAPAEIDPDRLLAACSVLADCVRTELGESVDDTPKPTPAPATTQAPAPAELQHGRPSPRYGAAALAAECAAVASTGQGGRNHRLNEAAFKAGTLIGAGHIDQHEAEVALLTAASQCGLPEHEAKATIASGLRAGRQHPRQVPERSSRPVPQDTAGEVKQDNVSTPDAGPLADAAAGDPWPATDTGNARRFEHLGRGRVKFDIRQKCWRCWDGTRWTIDQNAVAATEIAQEVSAMVLREAAEASGEQREVLGRWALKSEDRPRVDAMLELASRRRDLCPSADAWDADPLLLNVANGVLDLSGDPRLLPHDPARLLTRLSPAQFDPAAPDPLWEKVLADWLPAHEVRAFIQRAAGACLSGEVLEKLFLVLGATNSGKSSFVEAISSTLGDYAGTADFSTFLKGSGRQGGSASEDIARLAGRRFVKASETEKGRELNEGLVKNLCGGERITARYLYGSSFEFLPTFKLWLVANDAPTMDAQDDAIWRRAVRVPFDATVPEGKRDPTVKRRLTDPRDMGATILAWLVQGYREFKRIGLAEPQAIKASREELRHDMDVLAPFFDERLTFGLGLVASAKAIREAYESWADDLGYRHRVSPKRLAAGLAKRGCLKEHTRSGTHWTGVGVLA